MVKSKLKKERENVNEIRIDLNTLLLSESFYKKNKYFRIEVALKDEEGQVYDVIHINK